MTGTAMTAITQPPTAYIYDIRLQMIRQVQRLQREIIGTIKVARHKSIKCVDSIPQAILFTKVMHFPLSYQTEWIEEQLLSRANTLSQIYSLNFSMLSEKKILQVCFARRQHGKTFYLTTRIMQGWNLHDILFHKEQSGALFDENNLKQCLIEVMSLLLKGKGFPNLIITNETLFFQMVHENKFKPRINYLSFAGYSFLKRQIKIDKEQYLQVAIFLDDEAYRTGNIDRLEFKVRNFACLILTLICQRNPADFVFQNCQLETVITKTKAQQLHQKVVQPRIKQLLGFSSVKKRIQATKVKGLHAFLLSAFQCPEPAMDWTTIRTMFLGQEWSSQSAFGRLANLLWSKQSNKLKKSLQEKGFGCTSNLQVYLAVKLGVNLQFLLKSNNWQAILEDSEYQQMNREMFFRALKYFLELDEQTLGENYQVIRQLAQLLLKNKFEFEQKTVTILTTEQEILLQYPQL